MSVGGWEWLDLGGSEGVLYMLVYGYRGWLNNTGREREKLYGIRAMILDIDRFVEFIVTFLDKFYNIIFIKLKIILKVW